MSSDSTKRFSKRAVFYASYRPRYPSGILCLLEDKVGLGVRDTVADVGSGTGFLTALFLENGNRVFAVEPNDQMRRYAEKALATFPGFVSVKGRAEQTTLPDATVDLIAVGQALHWFDQKRTLKEFSRISKQGASLCIVYNERDPTGEFMRAYQDLVKRYERDRAGVPDVDDRYASRFFGGRKYAKFTLPNEQVLDLKGLKGRLMSASYMPMPGEGKLFTDFQNDVGRLFDDYNEGGQVALEYVTEVYVGKVAR